MENTVKMTQIDIYEKIKAIVGVTEDEDKDVIIEFCDKKIAQAVDKREKAQAKAAEKKAESDEMTDAIADILTNEGQTADQIAEVLVSQFADITKAKVVSRMGKLVNAGRAAKIKDGKNPMVYVLPETE